MCWERQPGVVGLAETRTEAGRRCPVSRSTCRHHLGTRDRTKNPPPCPIFQWVKQIISNKYHQ